MGARQCKFVSRLFGSEQYYLASATTARHCKFWVWSVSDLVVSILPCEVAFRLKKAPTVRRPGLLSFPRVGVHREERKECAGEKWCGVKAGHILPSGLAACAAWKAAELTIRCGVQNEIEGNRLLCSVSSLSPAGSR